MPPCLLTAGMSQMRLTSSLALGSSTFGFGLAASGLARPENKEQRILLLAPNPAMRRLRNNQSQPQLRCEAPPVSARHRE